MNNFGARLKNAAAKRLRAVLTRPLVHRLAAPLVLVRRTFWPATIHLEKIAGLEKSSGQPLTVVCGVTGQGKHYLLDAIFNGSPGGTGLGKMPLRDVIQPQPAVGQAGELLIVDAKKHHALPNTGGWFFIPIWVTGRINLPIPAEFLKRDTVKSDLRKIRRHGFEYEITHAGEQFDDFFHNMHVPFITKTYGDEACFDSYAEKRRQCENFDLLLVRKKSQSGQFIAGILIIYDPAGPRMWSLGVRDDGEDYVGQGVMPALYHFTFEHLLAKGFTRINTGSSRAFLNDGVLKFKKKMAQSLTGGSWQGFALKIGSLTPAVKSFLLQHPFIFEVEDRLHGAVFSDEPLVPETIQRLEKEYFHPGLAKLVIYSFRPETLVLPVSAERIEVRSVNDLLA